MNAQRARIIAERQNLAFWAGKPMPPLLPSIAARLEENAHNWGARVILARRQRIAAAIRDCITFPGLFYNHRYFNPLPGGCAVDAEDAVKFLRIEIRKQRNRVAKRHRSVREHASVAELAEAMVFARFMRRIERNWLRRAA